MSTHAAIRPRWGRALRSASALPAVAAGLLASTPGAALEWTSVPNVTVAASHDDNLRLDPFDPRDVGSVATTVSADIAGRAEKYRVAIAPQIRALRYDDDRESDSNDAFATFDFGYSQERNQ